MKIGTRIRTAYEYSEAGKVVKPRAENLPMPGPDWCLVEFDDRGDGRRYRMCIHRSMLVARNEA